MSGPVARSSTPLKPSSMTSTTCHELGIDQLTFDFRVDGIGPCIQVMEHLAEHVLPVAERLG